MGRLLAIGGGIAWLLAIASIAFAVHWSDPPRRVPPLTAVPTLLRELSVARASQFKEGEAWVVTKVTSAHRSQVRGQLRFRTINASPDSLLGPNIFGHHDTLI